MAGVTVGHGAVIGAMSVVTSDVPPYAVVAGNPARVIRHRQPPEMVERLLSTRLVGLADRAHHQARAGDCVGGCGCAGGGGWW